MRTSQNSRLFSLLLVLGSAAACGVVAPLDDVDPATGSSVTGGTSSTGGTSAQGGNAGSGAQGGENQGGDAGVGAQGGAGSGGVGNSGGISGNSGSAGTTGGDGGSAGTTGGDGGSAGTTGGDGGTAGTTGGDGGDGGTAGTTGGDGGSAGDGGGGSGGSPTEVEAIGVLGGDCNKPGDLACNGHAQPLKLICEDGKWKSNGVCEGGGLCETKGVFAGTCRPLVPECEGKQPGEASCNGAERIICGVDLTSSTKVTCASAAHCQQGVGESCALCLDGEFACDGVALNKCADDNLSFVKVKDCATAIQCNAGAGECTDKACVVDQHKCDGDLLQVCNGTQTGFENKESCNPGLCDAIGKQCDVCSPGETSCKDGQTQLACSTDGQSLDEVACPGDKPFCSAGKCVACKADSDCPVSANECQLSACALGVCVLNPVASGTPVTTQNAGDCQKKVCDGNGAVIDQKDDLDVPNDDNNSCTSQACKDGLPDFPPLPKDTACEGGQKCDGEGTCGACEPGSKRCNGTKVQVCDASKKFVDDTTCGGNTPYCSAGACVQCLADTQCTSSDECLSAVCSAGTCGTAGKALGTPLASQTAGDCKTAVCDGIGGTTTQPNTGDLPTPSGDCVTAACNADGTTAFPSKSAGTACGNGGVCNGTGKCGVCIPGAKQCSGNGVQTCNADGQWATAVACSGGTPYCSAGACVACTQVSHCTGAGECRTAACASNACQYTNKADNTLALTQSSNDCKKNVCISGAVVSQNDNTDLPIDDGKECTDQSCSNGNPVTTNKAAGTSCSQGVCDGLGTCGTCTPGEKRCNSNTPEICLAGGTWQPQAACGAATPYCSAGACVACTQASHCTAANECQIAQCSGTGTCGVSFKSSGTLISTQNPGDCQDRICDGAGNIISKENNADLPIDDGNPCTDQSCSNGVPTTTNKAAGTSCGGAQVCSGTGICGDCVPTSKRCTGNTPEICNASGKWTANGTCGAGAPYCSVGNCVACTQNSHCGANPACQTGTCTATNTCTYTNKPIAQTCGDSVKCSFEFCDDGNTNNCGSCNAGCTGPGNGLPSSVCTGSCDDASAEDILSSTLVGCADSTIFSKRDLPCQTGWEAAPAEAWVRWRNGKQPSNNYWTDDPLLYGTSGSSGSCSVATSGAGYSSCGADTPMRVCTSTQPDSQGNNCNWTGCGFETNTPNQYFGGCAGNNTAGSLCWKNPCADKSVEQIFGDGMAGCGGAVTYANRKNLCGAGYHVCNAAEYMSRRNNLAPTNIYWTDTVLKYASGGATNACAVDNDSGENCLFGTGGSMKVCGSASDSFGNTCTWTGCGFETNTPNQYFGGCGNTTAGALCCADTPCADGTTEQVFDNGMVGCSGSVAFGDRAALCGAGYHTATASDWIKYSNGITPNFHYWTETQFAYSGSDGACSVDAVGTPGYTTCSGLNNNGPMHVCSPNNTAAGHKDPAGNNCTYVKCGYKTNNPNLNFGGCNSTAGTLCIPD